MTDPRDFDRRMENQMEMERRMSTPTPWGWIAGAVFIIVILALVFTSSEGTRTARDDGNPPATTGMGPPTAPPAMTVPPGRTPSTTGQAGSRVSRLSRAEAQWLERRRLTDASLTAG